MEFYGITDIGNGREVNEDAYRIGEKGERYAIVADGMGGHQAGEVASNLSADVMVNAFREMETPSRGAMRAAIDTANNTVYARAKTDSFCRGMGTTLTAICETDDSVLLAHIGDSRAYRLRKGVLKQMSEEHSYVAQLVASGEITPEEARTHPERNLITKALGVGRHIEPQVSEFTLRRNDVWLLCSDGLTEYLDDEELCSMLLEGNRSWQDKLKRMVETALQRGGSDNITAVIAVCGKEV